MTAADIARIRDRHEQRMARFSDVGAQPGSHARDIDRLLAEIDRRTAILRPIVLAEPSTWDSDGDEVCFFCGWIDGEHAEDCLWRQARELLGAPDE